MGKINQGGKFISALMHGAPKGTRTPVAGMKTLSPRPLDDGDNYE